MRIVTVATALLFMSLSGWASAQDAERGRNLFLDHCATCHGREAQGDGPMSGLLSIPPADLSILAFRNGGTFPVASIVRRIDGESEVLAHGGPMPLFGLVLQGPSGIVVSKDGSEVIASEAIVDIVTWLEEIQL